jgi:Tol biopolymer transport system component
VNGYQKSFLVWIFVAGFLLSGCRQENSQKENLSAPPPEPSQTTSSPTPTVQTASISSGCKKIAFSMTKDTISDIYTICPDGSTLTNITNDESLDSHPAWSPDGTKIAFASSHDGSSQIYITDENGNNPTKLTFDNENDFPVWLPDGKHIAFRTTDGKGLWWWRIANIETDEISQFSEPSYDFFFQTPAWSSDGQYLAYMSLIEQQQRNDGSSQIHIKNADGSSDIALTNDVWANINPVWSPDNTRMAFLSERDGNYNMFALYVMNKDGTNIKKLTEPSYPENVTFSWSPDGQQIVISSDVSLGNIYVIDIATRNSRELLHLANGESASAPSWQP